MGGLSLRRLGGFNPAAGGGGISFVGSKTFTHNSTSAQSCSLTDLKDTAGGDATLTELDFILMGVSQAHNTNRSQAQLLCLDPGTNAYTAAHGDLYADDFTDTNLQVQYKFMGASPDTTVTVPASPATSAGMACTLFAFRGVNTTTPMDVAATTATGTNTGVPVPPAITPATAGAWIFSISSVGGSLTDLTNGGNLSTVTNHFRYAERNELSHDAQICCGLYTAWSVGAFTPTITGGVASTDCAWASVSGVLRPA